MRLLVVYPAHMNPGAIASFVGGALGDGWAVTGVPEPGADPNALASAEAILCAISPLRAADLERAPALRFVQTSSHGFDHIDVDAAAERGISVANVGTSGAEAGNVAEHALLLMLACAKRLVDGHLALREGRWPQQELLGAGIWELAGKTLGILGMGQIGRELATRARALGMELVYHDLVPAPDAEEAHGMRLLGLDELLRTADVVSVHVPLTEATRGLIGAREIALLKRGAILVNTARGPVVDNAALAVAASAGRVLAGVDVFDPEPPPPDHPLLHARNVVLSPHVAGVTRESVQRIMAAAIENLRRFAAGEPPRDVVNGV